MTTPVVEIVLATTLAEYRDEKPTKKERSARGIDGSKTELQIVSALIRHDLSDEEIIGYFERYDLPRYVDEGRSESWLRSLIKTARSSETSYLLGADVTAPPHTPRVEENQHTLQKKRSYANPTLPFYVLRERLEGEETGQFLLLGEWYQEIIEVSARSTTKPLGLSAARALANKLREREFVTAKPLPGNRRQVMLTEEGRRWAEPLPGGWPKTVPVRGALRSGELFDLTQAADGGKAKADPRTEQKATRRRREPSEERKRSLAVVNSRRWEQINDFHRISVRGTKIRYLQLLTPPDEWIGADVWESLLVGFDVNGRESFAWINSEDPPSDPVRQLAPSGWQPYNCLFALAAEMEPDGDSFRVAEYIDEYGEILPKIGVIEQCWSNFYRHINKLEDPLDVLKIKGTGSGEERKFQITTAADPIKIETDLTLDQLLASLASANHERVLKQLPGGWFHMPLQRKKLVWKLLGLDAASNVGTATF